MKHRDQFHPSVVVQVHGSYGCAPVSSKVWDGDAVHRGQPSHSAFSRRAGGDQSGDFPGPAVSLGHRVDPHAEAVAWPGRWSAYLRATFRTYHDVARAFHVSERTATTWWRGETGCKAPHLVVALKTDPERATEMLLGEGGAVA